MSQGPTTIPLEPIPGPIPGSGAPARPTPVWLWVLTVILLGAVSYLQSPGGGPAPTAQDRAAAIGEHIDPPEAGILVLLAKMSVLMRQMSGANGGAGTEPTGKMLLTTIDDLVGTPAAAEPPAPPSPDDVPPSAAERLRGAIVAAELAGPKAALDRLARLREVVSDNSDLRADIDALETIYSQEGDWTDEARDGLIERHGWFARLALSYNSAGADQVRDDAEGDAMKLVVFMLGFGLLFLLALLAGVVLLIVGLVFASGGRLRRAFTTNRVQSAPVAPRIWLETFALFAGCFLLLKFVGKAVAHFAGTDAGWTDWVPVGGQWVLTLALLWPLVRGVPWRQMRAEVGWHSGRGIAREIGAGLLAYLASLPIFIAVAIVVAMMIFVQQALSGHKGPPPSTRVNDLLSKDGPWMFVAIAILIVAWAPLVEESIFRGVLYRHFRSRLGFPLGALLTGAFFALMHPYMPIQLLLIATLGIIFCVMREWRSSLIPSMTAHCVHNTGVLIILTVTMRFMRM